MTTIASLRQSFKCESCGQWLTAPKRSTHVNEDQITHLWACSKCGNEFETSISLTQEVPLSPEVVDTFLPSLLVA
jgi:transcription elongation factor Elf1